jgi:hypothetical protein
VADVSLPSLTAVGDLSISGPSVRSLELPSLLADGGRLWVALTGVKALAFPSLTHVAGAVGIMQNPEIQTLSFPLLPIANSLETNPNAYGSNGFEVTSNHALTSLEAPSLASVGGDTNLLDNALRNIDLPAYTTGNLTVSGNPVLTSLSAPAFHGNALTVTVNPALTSPDLTGLESPFSLTVADNSALDHLDFLALVSTGSFQVSRNPGLTS